MLWLEVVCEPVLRSSLVDPEYVLEETRDSLECETDDVVTLDEADADGVYGE